MELATPERAERASSDGGLVRRRAADRAAPCLEVLSDDRRRHARHDPRRREPRDPRGRDARAARPVGLGQVDDGAADGGAHRADAGRGAVPRRGARRREPVHVDRLPELRALPMAHRRGKRPDRAHPAEAVGRPGSRRARARARPHRPVRLSERLSEGAVRRHAAARRLRARAGRAPGDPLHGRAVQRARRADRREPPDRSRRALARIRPRRNQEHLLRHAQHRRSGVHGEPDRHHLIAPGAHQARDPEPAAVSARRELGGICCAGRADPRGDHGDGAPGRAGRRGAPARRNAGSARAGGHADRGRCGGDGTGTNARRVDTGGPDRHDRRAAAHPRGQQGDHRRVRALHADRQGVRRDHRHRQSRPRCWASSTLRRTTCT